MRLFHDERGIASVAALLLLATAISLTLTIIAIAKNEQKDTYRYIVETRLQFAAEDNAAMFIKRMETGELPKGRFVNPNEEILFSDSRENDIRRRIYIKGASSGITVYSFADAKNKMTGLNMYKQIRFFMEQTDNGYVFKHILP